MWLIVPRASGLKMPRKFSNTPFNSKAMSYPVGFFNRSVACFSGLSQVEEFGNVW
jgi:hypothetical protein